jgi:hypothetical protein
MGLFFEESSIGRAFVLFWCSNIRSDHFHKLFKDTSNLTDLLNFFLLLLTKALELTNIQTRFQLKQTGPSSRPNSCSFPPISLTAMSIIGSL